MKGKKSEDLADIVSKGKVVVLRAGEERQTVAGFYAPATITLIKPNDNYVALVDCGSFGESGLLVRLLRDRGVLPGQVRSVAITHNHPDHLGNVGIFGNAQAVMPDSSFDINRPNYFGLMPKDFYLNEGGQFRPSSFFPDMFIVPTPGHAGWDFSVVCISESRKIAVVGDLFWSQEDWEHDSEYLGLCVNPEMQKRSRDYVRNILRPEVIIPGHGPAFAPKY